MTKGKAWSVDEERLLKELVEGGFSPEQIAARMGKTVSGVTQKMSRMGLRVVERTQIVCSTSTSEPLPEDLPSTDEAMKLVWCAMKSLEQPGLSHSEVQRLRGLILGGRVYDSMFANRVNYSRIQEELQEMRKKLDAINEEKENAPS